MVDLLAQRYGKLPTEILALPPGDLYLNFCTAFPETIRSQHDRRARRAREHKLGYSPTARLLEALSARHGRR
jgi:hypothetical protein